MALSIAWGSDSVIDVPLADLTFDRVDPISGLNVYKHDMNVFHQNLRSEEASEGGRPYSKTHSHNTTVQVGSILLARSVIIIAPFTVRYEDGQYAVELEGANTNVSDVAVVNQVSVRPGNTAGLIDATILAKRIEMTVKAMYNRQHSNSDTGKFEQYNDANDAIEYQGDLFMDNARLVPYDGTDDILIRDIMNEVP